jgi:hypothetical protein
MEIRFNNITFGTVDNKHGIVAHDMVYGPAQRFKDFLAGGAVKRAAWLTNIILECDIRQIKFFEDIIEQGPHLVSVARFCRKHPHVNVEYIVGCFYLDRNERFQSVNIIYVGLFLHCLFGPRHPRLEDILAPTDNNATQVEYVTDTAWHNDRLSIEEVRNARNFRFFPYTKDFDKAVVWRRFQDCREILAGPAMALTKTWVEEGI